MSIWPIPSKDFTSVRNTHWGMNLMLDLFFNTAINRKGRFHPKNCIWITILLLKRAASVPDMRSWCVFPIWEPSVYLLISLVPTWCLCACCWGHGVGPAAWFCCGCLRGSTMGEEQRAPLLCLPPQAPHAGKPCGLMAHFNVKEVAARSFLLRKKEKRKKK